MRRARRLAPLVLALAGLSSCVSLEEARMPPGLVAEARRVVLVVHAAPGPLIDELDTKVETAAKILPGLGLVVQSAQEERLLEAAKGLGPYLPAWGPEGAFYAALAEALAARGARLVTPAEAGIATSTFRAMSPAKDQLEWRRLYAWEHPDYASLRDYSRLLTLDDALILEANLAYGLRINEEGAGVPSLDATLRLVKPGTMRRLWRAEESASTPAAAKSLYEFKVRPEELVGAWTALMKDLAERSVETFLRAAGPRAFAPPAEAPSEPPSDPPSEPPSLTEEPPGAILPQEESAR